MSGGGGGPTNSTVTQTSSNLPAFAEPYYHDLMQRTAYATSQPYETYQGQRVADFSPYEQEAMARMTELGMSGENQNLTQASSTAGRIANEGVGNVMAGASSSYAPGRMGNAGAYNPTNRDAQYTANQLSPDALYWAQQRDMGFDAGTLNDSETMQSYMNPYTQNVVDVQKREAMRDADIRNTDLGLSAARQGGLGGYRDAILRAENERNLTQQLGDIQATGQQSAFANAQQAYEQDRAARAQQEQFGQSQFGLNESMRQRQAELMQQGFSADEAARQAQEQFAQGQFGLNSQNSQFGARIGIDRYNAQEAAKQAAQQFGLQAYGMNQNAQYQNMMGQLDSQRNQLAAAGQLGGYANQQQGMEMERLGMLQGVGNQQRQLAQAGLDTGYQDYLRQQAYPYEQLSFMSNIMQGNAVAPGSTTTMFGPQPSGMQQAIGTGIAGLGMYNAMQG